MSNSRLAIRVATFLTLSSVVGTATSKDQPIPPGPFRAEFVYAGGSSELGACTAPTVNIATSELVVDAAVGFIVNVTESLIDAIAAATRPEVTTREFVVPLEGFYEGDGIAIDGGCLVFHNVNPDNAKAYSIKAMFKVRTSTDKSAFRFEVEQWEFTNFLNPNPKRIAQKQGIRDFVLKIEFLKPGAKGLGQEAVFVELPFKAADVATINSALAKPKDDRSQSLPWFAAPSPPSGNDKGLRLPLNIRVSLVETTKPNQFAVWLGEFAEQKKPEISAMVQNAVRESLDQTFAASEAAKAAGAAGTAYDAYKAAWDILRNLFASKPTDPAELKVWEVKVTTQTANVYAARVAAKAAFDAADLKWPGDLPSPAAP